MGISRKFQECFNEVSRVFTKTFKGVLRSLKGVFRKFPECYMEVSENFKGVSRKY